MDEQEKMITSIEDGEFKLKNAIYDAEKRIQQGYEQVTKMASDIDKKAHDNPWPIVAGVGISCLLLGLLIGKSKN
ncbi:MAG: hypothetical protein HQL12_06745 [Candidatus Omnitrophica bacterium]|nr:hypothetical protein [Candidatus Omnitrophota bacterium]